MDIYLVFNELSAEDGKRIPDADKYAARGWMSQFVSTITASRRHGIKSLKTYDDFLGTELVADYTIRDWLNDEDVIREEKQRVKSAGTAYPCLRKPENPTDHARLPEDIQLAESHMLEFEFVCAQRCALGLGSAYLLESICISLATSEMWANAEISLDIEQIDEELDDIVDKTEIVRHVSNAMHIELHRAWVQDRFMTSVSNGTYLLTKYPEWFPNLILVDDVRKQIDQMGSGTPQLRQAVKKLFELEAYCADWKDGGFDSDKLASKASPESNTVRDNPDLRKLRMFFLPDGREVFFEWHLRLTPNAWRLHFYPDTERRKIAIGYIGPKLPTAKYGH